MQMHDIRIMVAARGVPGVAWLSEPMAVSGATRRS